MNKPKYGGLDYPIGCKVIIKSNEPTYYQVGILKRVDIVGSDRTELPIVEVGGVEYGVMGIVRKYDERRTRALDKLTPDEQWNVMAEFHMVGTSTCGRCEDYHNMGLSDTCPSCDMIGESYQKAQPTNPTPPTDIPKESPSPVASTNVEGELDKPTFEDFWNDWTKCTKCKTSDPIRLAASNAWYRQQSRIDALAAQPINASSESPLSSSANEVKEFNMTSERRCPRCLSAKVKTERRPNGMSACNECGWRDYTVDFDKAAANMKQRDLSLQTDPYTTNAAEPERCPHGVLTLDFCYDCNVVEPTRPIEKSAEIRCDVTDISNKPGFFNTSSAEPTQAKRKLLCERDLTHLNVHLDGDEEPTNPTPPSDQEWTSIEIFRRIKSGDDIGLPEDFVSLNTYKQLERELKLANDNIDTNLKAYNAELAEAQEIITDYRDQMQELGRQLLEDREELEKARDHRLVWKKRYENLAKGNELCLKQYADEKQAHEATKLELEATSDYCDGLADSNLRHEGDFYAAKEREAKLKAELDGLNAEIKRLYSVIKSGEQVIDECLQLKRLLKSTEEREHQLVWALELILGQQKWPVVGRFMKIAREALEQNRKARGDK